MSNVSIYNVTGAAVQPKLFNNSGNWNTKASFSKLEEDIRMLLMTSRGTMIGDPDYGSNIYQILYNGNNSATGSMIRYEIHDVLEKYYPEIQIDQIDIEFDKNTVNIYMKYHLSRTNVSASMILEFIKSEA